MCNSNREGKAEETREPMLGFLRSLLQAVLALILRHRLRLLEVDVLAYMIAFVCLLRAVTKHITNNVDCSGRIGNVNMIDKTHCG